jgi:hypothetical protein
MKLKLDIDSLNNDFFEDTRMLGIIAPLRNYFFCWQINNVLGVKFKLNPEIEIQIKKKERDYFFNIYEWNEPETFLTHYLYQNQYDGQYLLPEFKHIDYLWLMKGEMVEDDKCNWMQKLLNNINGVQLIIELTNKNIKTKSNLVF